MKTKLPVIKNISSSPSSISSKNSIRNKLNSISDNEQGHHNMVNNVTLKNDMKNLNDFEKDMIVKSKNPCSKTFIDYSEKTSIHGIQYIGELGRTLLERFTWICILLIAMYFCTDSIVEVFEKWYEKPVLVSLESQSTPVWKIPFPAITICPNKQFSKSDFDFLTALSELEDKNISLKDKSYLETFGQICIQMEEIPTLRQRFFGGKGFNETLKMSYLLNEIKSLYKRRYNDTSTEKEYCKWGEGEYSNDCFGSILTEYGFCKTINFRPPDQILRAEAIHDETFLNGSEYDKHNNQSKRVMGAGMKHGLEMIFSEIKNDDYDLTCTGPIQGFQLVLHSTAELGDISNQFIQVPLGHQVLISIKPRIMSASKKVMKYSPQIRQCYFQGERYLRFFITYNQRNCQIECLANYTLSTCSCVPYFMPRNKSTPICGLPNLECCNSAEKLLNKLEYDDDFDDVVDTRMKKCNCLPDCNSISYDTEINAVENNYNQLFVKIIQITQKDAETEEKLLMQYKNIAATKFFIYYKEDRFIRSQRSELFSTTDLIAQCGGLLGLFMGVSIISLVEIIYFLTIRLFVNLKRN